MEDMPVIRTRDIYQSEIDHGIQGYAPSALELVAHATNTGIPEGCNAAAMVGRSKRHSIALQLFARVNPETELVEQAGFRAHGCLAMIASGTAIAHMIEGTTLSMALSVSLDDLRSVVGETPGDKAYTARYAIEAVKALEGDYRIRQGMGYQELQARLRGCDRGSIDCIACENCSLRDIMTDLQAQDIVKSA